MNINIFALDSLVIVENPSATPDTNQAKTLLTAASVNTAYTVNVLCIAIAYDAIYASVDDWDAVVTFVSSKNTTIVLESEDLTITISKLQNNALLITGVTSVPVDETDESALVRVQLIWAHTINGVSVTQTFNSSEVSFSFYDNFASSHLLLHVVLPSNIRK